MKRLVSNPILLTLLFFVSSIFCGAQEFSESGLNVGLKVGATRLLGEIKNDFSGVINEFDNKFGVASGFEISKYISPHMEIGGEIDNSILNGNTYSPQFSAEGFQPGIPSEIIDPVEYKNNLLSLNLHFRYFFKPVNSESSINPFIRAGAGYLNYNSKFKYIDAPIDDLLFGKGTEGYSKLSTPVFFLGTGFKTPLLKQFYLITSIDFNFVNYDFMDVMHNYNSNGDRLKVTGLSTEFKIGISYNIIFSSGKKTKQKNTRTGRTSNDSHLPFSR